MVHYLKTGKIMYNGIYTTEIYFPTYIKRPATYYGIKFLFK